MLWWNAFDLRRPVGAMQQHVDAAFLDELRAEIARGLFDSRPYITARPGVVGGKPGIRGTRISVDLVLDLLSAGASVDDLLREYPAASRESLQAALAFASEWVRTNRNPLLGENGGV